MPTYINHFTCNYEAWPADQDRQKAAWAKMVRDADESVKEGGLIKFIGWTNNSEGYVLLEADSKADVIKECARFWPLFHNDIMEVVPAAEAGAAILAGTSEGW